LKFLLRKLSSKENLLKFCEMIENLQD
jgi:hypothetical protein